MCSTKQPTVVSDAFRYNLVIFYTFFISFLLLNLGFALAYYIVED